MNSLLKYIGIVILLILCDAPWLYMIQAAFGKMLRDIQGSGPTFRVLPALIVYVALAYLVQQATSVYSAFMLGLSTYAVFEFTNLTVLVNYDPYIATADSIWGGILMSIVYSILQKFQF